MGNKAVRLDIKGNILTVDDTVYKLTSGLLESMTNKHPRHYQYIVMIKKYIDRSLHRPGLEHTLRGNGVYAQENGHTWRKDSRRRRI